MSSTSRRLRWALLVAVALHALLLWHFAPQLKARFDAARKSAPAPSTPPDTEVAMEIAPPPPPPPKGPGLSLATHLAAAGSPEKLADSLPAGFFAKPVPLSAGTLHLSGRLQNAPRSGAELVANIIPAAIHLPHITAISAQARTPRPRPAPQPVAAAPLKAAIRAAVVAEEPRPASAAAPSPVPFALPPETDDPNVEATILRATTLAQQTARDSNPGRNASSDYRDLLQQGPLIAETPLPARRAPPRAGGAPVAESGISTFALDAPVARDQTRAAPDQGKAATAARQQFFSQLTAQLKATNQRVLAEAIKAGVRVSVRMRFVIDRQGRILELNAVDPVPPELEARAAAVIRAAPLPRVPDALPPGALELSFPVEVYR